MQHNSLTQHLNPQQWPHEFSIFQNYDSVEHGIHQALKDNFKKVQARIAGNGRLAFEVLKVFRIFQFLVVF